MAQPPHQEHYVCSLKRNIFYLEQQNGNYLSRTSETIQAQDYGSSTPSLQYCTFLKSVSFTKSYQENRQVDWQEKDKWELESKLS